MEKPETQQIAKSNCPQCGHDLDLSPPGMLEAPVTRAREDYMVAGRKAMLALLREQPDPSLEDFVRLQTELHIEQEKLSAVLGSLVSTGEVRYKGRGYEVVTD